MDFSFPQEQIELADALGRWLSKNYNLSTRRTALVGDTNLLWDTLGELGVTTLMANTEHEGFGGHAEDLFLTMRELGRGLAVSPFWSTAVVAKAIEWAGDAKTKQLILPKVAQGQIRLALAFGESNSRHDLDLIETCLVQDTAQPAGSFFRLDGIKHVVLFGAQAEYFLVSARLDGKVCLLLVPAETPGIEQTLYRTLDGLSAVDLKFSATPIPKSYLLNPNGNGLALVERIADYGAALLCAEAVGLMELAKDVTLEHLKNRHQFGSLLSKFQALQHRMVDIMIQLEQARSMAYLAVANCESDDPKQSVRSVSAAKSLVGDASRYVGQQCVQLHGAMGLTDDCVVSHVLKRLTMIDLTLGDSDHHLSRFAGNVIQ